ncbi:TniQ family protein [Leisingera aquimarina]|uniref:TniQ family protein n=1 Tax=Leisingera aquimarina TaxID=476529 RepID=UPI000A060872|nr:TniQ family protein [Leisingera aquimarina]
MLLPFLPFEAHETPISFGNRLSAFHARSPLISVAKDFGIDPLDMVWNKPEALERLAEVSGVSAEILRQNAPIALGEREYDLRGETVSAEFLSSPKIVYCPACLHEDDQRGERCAHWSWALAVMRTCPVHEIALQRNVTRAWNDRLQSLDHLVPERGEALQIIVASAPRRVPSPLQDYVLHRLEGREGPEWLDAQSLEQAVRATELLGVLLEFGAEQNLPALASDDWDRAGRTGYAFTARGEAGIREALQQQFDRFSTSKGTPGARKIFGCFYKALAYSKSLKEPGDIARILREFIWDRIAMPADTKVLGKKLLERRLHTVASLALETDHDPRRLHSMLVGQNIIPEDAASHFAIPVEIGRAVAARVKRIVKITKLPDALNCTRPMVDQLCAERLLRPIYYGTPGINGKLQKGVDGDEVVDLTDALSAKATLSGDVSGLVTIAKAAEKAKIPGVCVVQLILAGCLQSVARIGGVPGIGGLRVCPSEVKAVAAATLLGMTATETFAALKLTRDAGWELVDRYPEEVSLTPQKIAGVSSAFTITRFLPETVSAFDARFTTLARAAEKHGPGVKELKVSLKKVGVKPVLPWREVGADIYKVSDIAKCLPS